MGWRKRLAVYDHVRNVTKKLFEIMIKKMSSPARWRRFSATEPNLEEWPAGAFGQCPHHGHM